MQAMTQTTEETELVFPKEQTAGKTPPLNAMIISWKERDWFWLKFFQKYVKNNPQDYLNKLVYRNYLKWYSRTNESDS